MGCGCNKVQTASGVYGFDMAGLTDNTLTLTCAFGGYVVAQKINDTVTYLKDNVKTSGLVWTGASLALNILMPQLAANKMVQGASIGMGVFGLKQLNKGYDILKGVNGTPVVNHAAEYQLRLQRAQQAAQAQARQIAPTGAPMAAVPQRAEQNPYYYRAA